MRALVAYASRNGATREIADRIGERLRRAGHDTDVKSVTTVPDVTAYDAFVAGSAVYLGHWQKEAVEFVQRNRTDLSDRPTWLFSSRPLGTEPTDAEGRDKRDGALLPEELEQTRRSGAPARPPRLLWRPRP